VYEKDLGPKTRCCCRNDERITNPNSSWQEAEDQQEEMRYTEGQRLAVSSDPGGEPLIKRFDRTFRNRSSTERRKPRASLIQNQSGCHHRNWKRGATTAYALLLSGLAAEIVLIDVEKSKAEVRQWT